MSQVMQVPKSVVKDSELYFVDNGAVYCGTHLGMTARYTGRDISGQKIERITPKVVDECVLIGFMPKCENCGLLPRIEKNVTPKQRKLSS